MAHYIDAEKLTKFEEALADVIVSSQGLCTYEACKNVAKREAPLLIASFQQEQQEQPEVDLEKEIDDYFLSIERWQVEDEPYTQLAKCARHFFELGLKIKEESK